MTKRRDSLSALYKAYLESFPSQAVMEYVVALRNKIQQLQMELDLIKIKNGVDPK